MTNLEEPEELCLCKNSNKNGWLFDCRYIIPIYQREYAWHWEDEITRLINDINSISDSESTTYRLGCMSVRTKDTAKFEVIDGQQRLTTIYLLLTALATANEKSKSEIVSPEIEVLTFEGREASNYTLCHIKELHSRTADNSVLRLDNGIVCAYSRLYDWAKGLDKTEREKFLNRLKRTTIYRIPIPQETDLCKYFIRMNARGKQLELSDILKARLMRHLYAEDLPWFNHIWTACSNMNSYLEKLLKDEDKKEFLNKPALDGVSFSHRDHIVEDTSGKPNLTTFVKPLLETKHIRGTSENKRSTPATSIDFESFIDFPTFLMHVLKLCALNNGIESLPLTETDDKRLLTFFEKNWEPIFGIPLSETPTEEMRRTSRVSVMRFIQTLVIARHLHDGWVLKRIDKKDWILRHLENGKDEQKNDKLTNSFGKLHDRILMMQACLRVTYTSSLSMPWVTELLHLLWQHRDWQHDDTPNDHGEEVLALLEGLASRDIRLILEKFSDRDRDRDPDLGTRTPHILFNFLDYLLWRDGLVNPKNNNDRECQKFQFAYWNSVEHWYPQHPNTPDQNQKYWPNISLSVDTFGNLFLLNSSDNSALSNLFPDEKLKRLQAKSENGLMLSLKAVDMMRATEKVGKSYKSWQDACKALAAEHINRLKEAVNAVE